MSTAISGSPAEPDAAGTKEDLSITESVCTDFVQMSSGFWASRERNRLMLLAAPHRGDCGDRLCADQAQRME